MYAIFRSGRAVLFVEVVEAAVGGGGQLPGPEVDVVESLVVDAVGLVGVLDQLVDGEGGVVGLDDGVGDLGRGHDGEGVHDPVGVFFPDFRDQESTHTGTGTTTKRVSQLEALEAIARFGLFTDDVEDRVDQLGTFGVVTLGPVVTGAGLTEDEVVGPEDLAEGTRADRVHGSGL